MSCALEPRSAMSRAAVSIALAALATLPACGRIYFDVLSDAGDPTGDGGSGSGGGGGTGSGSGGTGANACMPGSSTSCLAGSFTLSTLNSPSTTGTTGDDADNTSGSCGGAGAHEHTVQFLVMQSGLYTFRVENTDFAIVLYIRDDSCTGTELACTTMPAGSTTDIALGLSAGQRVVAFVDGDNGECGSFTLRAGTNL